MNDSRTISLTTFGQTLTGIDDVKQCVVLLFTTPKGSDPLRPDYGLDIFSFLDQPSNQLAGVKKDILQQIANYETRITKVDNITVTNDALGNINISVKFTSIYGSATVSA